MLRQEVDEKDFRVELEKMTVKDKYNSLQKDNSEDDLEVSDYSLSDLADKEEAKAAMVYIKAEKVLDLGKLKATDYKYNKHVFLPRNETTEKEALHEVRRVAMLDIFRKSLGEKQTGKHRKKEDDEKVKSNLTKSELAGMKSLQKRVQNNEIIITETDKSRKFCVMTVEQYYSAGQKHTKNDMKVSCDQVKSIQKFVNDHSAWLRKIFGLGASWGHEDRLNSSMTDRGEVVAPLYLLIKDHKGWSFEDGVPPPSRPVCSGNKGFGRHISEILSLILESLGHATGGEDIDSTGSLLAKVTELNNNLKKKDWSTIPSQQEPEEGVFEINQDLAEDSPQKERKKKKERKCSPLLLSST